VPELPEVETMVRGIRSGVIGKTLTRVTACPCLFRPIELSPSLRLINRQVRGRRLEQVARAGKRVVLHLESGHAFVIEPRMTGLMLLAEPPDEEHLRVEWKFAEGPSLWFWDRRGLGTVRLLDPEQFQTQLGPERLGPDPLGMTATDWLARLSRVRRELKVALMDQRVVAGIGNIYASEILHLARLHPRRRTETLRQAHVIRLAAAADEVLDAAIRHEGSTLADGTYRNALNQDGRYQNAHRVYAREGEPCRTCRRGRVRRIVQAQRATFFCPICQRSPKGEKSGPTPTPA
jgi:formamidopyrimidine-DNA glycosylase